MIAILEQITVNLEDDGGQRGKGNNAIVLKEVYKDLVC